MLAEVAPLALAVGCELVVSVQAVSLVDHVCQVGPEAMKELVKGQMGGSHRVELEELKAILTQVGEYFSKAGGSASNTMRTLAGFGIGARIVGSRGQDEWGPLWLSSMRRAGVDVSRIAAKEGATGRCCILSCEGQRTMRTCLDNAARVEKEELALEDFAGAQWVYLSAYCLYAEGLLERSIELAQAVGCRVALDLGSFEIVRAFRHQLTARIEGGAVALCFCNEDEAAEVAGGGAESTPEAGLRYLAQYCDIAVVTLGDKGCLVKERRSGHHSSSGTAAAAGRRDGGEPEELAVPACSGVTVVDSTGAGDSFAAGFLYSIIRGYSLRRAAEIGCLAGAAVVQALGSEMGPAQWQWLHSRLHGELAGEAVRSSAAAVQQELLACYALIERRGRGVVYYGSARLKEGSPHYEATRQLGADVARLLQCATWSGGGPGLMEAATKGAMGAGGCVAGIRIAREAGTAVLSASYLPADSAVVCRFLSSRKVALVDSGVRMKESDRTAYIFLPGGLGTMDELYEILTLQQLKKLGTRFPVPVILCNWRCEAEGGYYDGIIDWMCRCESLGTVGARELSQVIVALDPEDVLAALAAYYAVEGRVARRPGRSVLRLSEWAAHRRGTNGTANASFGD